MKVWNEMNCKNLTWVITGLATLALVGGCCATRSSEHAYYSRTPAYAGGTVQEEQPQSTSTVQSGNTSMVVPLYAESVNVGKREVDSGAVRLKNSFLTFHSAGSQGIGVIHLQNPVLLHDPEKHKQPEN